MKNLLCGSVAIVALAAAQPASARECRPEQRMCDDLPCPPCPPPGSEMRGSPLAAEAYRLKLENFRVDLEAVRETSGDKPKGYDKAIAKYRDGIEAYRSAK